MISTGETAKGIHADARIIQDLMHNLGAEQFLEALVLASYNASDDTSDFEYKAISEDWNSIATSIQSLIDDNILIQRK